MYNEPTPCRVCGHSVHLTGYPRYYCCNGDMCGCGGGTLPDNVCSSDCFENEDSLPPLELLEDDEPPRDVCKHCGKEFEEFADLGCEYCDRRHPDYGVMP